MSRQVDIQKLISIYQRRLQKLKEQEARYGISTPPAVLLEIEDIEIRLEKLQMALANLETGSEPDSAVEDIIDEGIDEGSLRDLAQLAGNEQPAGQTQMGSTSFRGISSSEITIGDINTQLTAGGDIVGRDKIIQYVYHRTEATTEAKPRLAYEPETVLIPAGSFMMGSELEEAHEAPPHTVYLDDYYVGRYPVTNKLYLYFIRQTDYVAGPTLRWRGQLPPEDKSDHPVAGVTWYEAVAYCQWLSEQTKRTYILPSEAQWEKAARGTGGFIYPWGNSWQEGRCNHQPDRIAAVTDYPAQNEYGCYDMVGNVREWTSTLWGYHRSVPDAIYRYPWIADDGRDDLTAPGHLRRVYRGGAAESVLEMRCSRRDGYLPDRPGPRSSRHGFRVVCIPAGK